MKINTADYVYSFHRPDWAVRTDAQREKRNETPPPELETKTTLFFKRKRQLTPALERQIEYRKALEAWRRTPIAHDPADIRYHREIIARDRALAEITRWTRTDRSGPLRLNGINLTSCPPLPEGVTQVDLQGNRITSLPAMRDMPQTLALLQLAGNPVRHFDQGNMSSPYPNLSVSLGTIPLDPAVKTQLDIAAPGPHYSYTQTAKDIQSFCERLENWIATAPDAKRRAYENASADIYQCLAELLNPASTSSAVTTSIQNLPSPGHIDLRNMGLETCPPIPQGVTNVDLRNNTLNRLPDMRAMPDTLQRLDLTGNPVRFFNKQEVVAQNPNLSVILGEINLTPEVKNLLVKTSPSPTYVFQDVSYDDQLRNWVASAGGDQQRYRQSASTTIFNWMQESRQLASDGKGKSKTPRIPYLNLNTYALTECPPLPDGVVEVDLSNNQFASLPNMKAMPNSLRTLNLAGNPIRQFNKDHASSNNPHLTVKLGRIVVTKELEKLLEDAEPGPFYTYTHARVVSDSEKPEGTSSASKNSGPASGYSKLIYETALALVKPENWPEQTSNLSSEEKAALMQGLNRHYKRLALKYHPDRTQDPDKARAAENFKLIGNAYSSLGNIIEPGFDNRAREVS